MIQDRAKWLEARKKGLGGSDIAAIMGLNPWKNAYQLYQEKTGKSDGPEENDAMRWGTLMEPTLRQFYSNETGREVRVPTDIIYHKEYPILFANPDGLTDDQRIVELKTARYPKGWGDPGSNVVPDSYALQVQQYMLVTGFPVADVVVSIGGALPVIYTVEADTEIHTLIIEAALDFWNKVESGEEPTPVTFADATHKFGLSATEGVVFADNDSLAAVEALKEVVAEIKELEEKEDNLRAKIVVALGDAGDTLVAPDGRQLVTWKKAAGRKTIDTKRLEKERPDIYAEYLKVGESTRRFLLK